MSFKEVRTHVLSSYEKNCLRVAITDQDYESESKELMLSKGSPCIVGSKIE